jgi:hypothetical protein
MFANAYPDQAAHLVRINPETMLKLIPFLIFKKRDITLQLFNLGGDAPLQWPLDEHENTILHLAAGYVPISDKHPEGISPQLDLVKRIVQSSPHLLTATNKLGQSAYQFRLSTFKRYVSESTPRRTIRVEKGQVPMRDDVITNYLKDRIMHLPDQQETIRLLYGDSLG